VHVVLERRLRVCRLGLSEDRPIGEDCHKGQRTHADLLRHVCAAEPRVRTAMAVMMAMKRSAAHPNERTMR
jgi:hypothetical protein